MSHYPPPHADDTVTVVCDESLRRRDPTVSVCIVTYNQEDYIEDALDSVLAQETTAEIEIIVGDDCSTDGTRAILKRYQQEHPELIRLHLHEEHYEGIPAKKNMVTNLEAARGRYVALLDGDDYWISTDKIERQVRHLDAHPEDVLCFHDARVVFENDDVASVHGSAETYRESDVHAKTMKSDRRFDPDAIVTWKDEAGNALYIPASSMVYRREAFSPVPDWFWHMWWGDRAMQFVFARHGSAYYHRDLLSCHRRVAEGMTTKYMHSMERNRRVVEQMHMLRKMDDSRRSHYAWELYMLYRSRARILKHRGSYVQHVATLGKSLAWCLRSDVGRHRILQRLRSFLF